MEEQREGSEQAAESGESEESRKRRIRAMAEELSESVFTKETRTHLIRASTELILAIDSMIPREKIPPEVKEHYLAAKRESILLAKALLDAQLKAIDEFARPEERPPEGLRKIELQ